MTLALDLGMTLSELEERVGSSELVLWKAYYTKRAEKKPGAKGG